MERNYTLLQTFTSDDIKLSGLFTEGDKNEVACIFIHGFCGDFYSHEFFHAMTQKLSETKVASVIAQNRGTGMRTEFLAKSGRWEDSKNLGGFYEVLAEAHLDISAWIKKLTQLGFKKFCLIGHSVGSIKTIRYLFEGEFADKIEKLVLLGPFEKNAFMERKAPSKRDEFLRIAEEMIKNGKGEEVVPLPDFEDYAVCYKTFYSWYENSDLSNVYDFYRQGYDFPVLKKINIPTLVVSGTEDESLMYPEFNVSPTSTLQTMKKHIKNCKTVLIKGSGHLYFGYEDEVSSKVADFLNGKSA